MNRYSSILFSFFFVIYSCKENVSNTDSNQTSQSPNAQIKKVEYGKKFFDYDEVEYYSTDISEEDAMKLMDENSVGSSQQKSDIILNDEYPKTVDNITFIKNLPKFGFKKYKIGPAKFKDLNKIFVEKSEQDGITFSCIPVFRDLLVFKKEKKVVGMAKICFDCLQYHIIGAKADIKNFGQGADYKNLGKILDETQKIK